MRFSSPILLLALLLPAAHAEIPSFGGLSTTGAPSGPPVPGVDFPMLEFDSQFKLVTSKARILLHQGGQTQALGILDQNALMATHDAYRFRDDGEDTPERARVDFLDFSLDAGIKIALQHPRKSLVRAGDEVGRIRQRALFSVGTGIDVYRKGGFKDAIGYVDQKAGKTFGRDLLRHFATFGLATPDKVYTFYEYVEVQEERGRWSFRKGTKTVRKKSPLFHFTTGTTSGTGPGGVFMTPAGKPILAIQGDWWVSQNIFDLLVRRVDNEGTAGKALRGGLAVLQALSGDDDGAAATLDEGQEFVRNSSAYLGSFLIGIVYFQEFRDLVGVQLPIAAIE